MSLRPSLSNVRLWRESDLSALSIFGPEWARKRTQAGFDLPSSTRLSWAVHAGRRNRKRLLHDLLQNGKLRIAIEWSQFRMPGHGIDFYQSGIKGRDRQASAQDWRRARSVTEYGGSDCFDISDFRNEKSQWNQPSLINYQTQKKSNQPRFFGREEVMLSRRSRPSPVWSRPCRSRRAACSLRRRRCGHSRTSDERPALRRRSRSRLRRLLPPPSPSRR
jgi:hypothetical protein